jgi:hypothetical protein
MSKKVLLPVILGVVLVLVVAGIALAQTVTPPVQSNVPATPAPLRGFGMGGFGMGGFGGVSWSRFDAAAKALNLTPTQLFEKLHGGETLAQVASDQGVSLATVQSAMQSAATTNRQSALGNWIDQAQQAGRLTADQANWLRQGLQNGWLNRLFRGLPFLGQPFLGTPGGMMGPGRMMRPGAGPRNFWQRVPRQGQQTPSATATPSYQ